MGRENKCMDGVHRCVWGQLARVTKYTASFNAFKAAIPFILASHFRPIIPLLSDNWFNYCRQPRSPHLNWYAYRIWSYTIHSLHASNATNILKIDPTVSLETLVANNCDQPISHHSRHSFLITTHSYHI